MISDFLYREREGTEHATAMSRRQKTAVVLTSVFALTLQTATLFALFFYHPASTVVVHR